MENKNKLPEEIEKILREPLDPKSISQHPTKTYLSSIKAIYVTERFNKAFGIGGWKTKVKFVTDGGGGMVVVKVTFTVPAYDIYYESFGGNDNGGENNKNFDLGDAYKGATTDAITKIGSFMEVGADVFKGISKASGSNNNKSDDNRPWLNDKQYRQALEKIANGEKDIYTKINTAFRMKKEYREQLQSA